MNGKPTCGWPSYLQFFSVQLLCSASTLPLYALTTQLGSNMKYTIFKSESTGAALKNWTNTAKKKHNDPNHVHSPLSTPSSTSHGSSMFDSSSDSSTPHVHTPMPLGHVGILGLSKALDEHGWPIDIPLGTKLHNGHVHGNGHPQTHGTQFTLFCLFSPKTKLNSLDSDEHHAVDICDQPNGNEEHTMPEEDKKPEV